MSKGDSALETIALASICGMLGASVTFLYREPQVYRHSDLLMPAAVGAIFSRVLGHKLPLGYLIDSASCAAGYEVGVLIANYVVRTGMI